MQTAAQISSHILTSALERGRSRRLHGRGSRFGVAKARRRE
jgi:hypothetical protein